MGKKKIVWANNRIQEMNLDKMLSKYIRKAKKKERATYSWYCNNCAVEVYQYRCKYCGKSELEKN